MTFRSIVQPLLALAVIVAVVSVVAATLRRRPAIERPVGVESPYRSLGFEATLAKLNAQVQVEADQQGLEVAPRADNLAIARRLSLALVGSGLSLEEVRALDSVPPDEQVRWWTAYLLNDARWSDYFAERFARAFVGTNDGPFLLFRRRKFNAWLSEQLAAGEPYDVIVRRMIAADGLWTDRPQVNFITATMDEDNSRRADPIRLAGRVSRVFLAQRIDCVQCHDDFLGSLEFGTAEAIQSGTQQHFHQLAAFFSGTCLPEPPFRGIVDDDQAYSYEYLGESESTVVEPAVPFQASLLPAEGEPRERLAHWVTSRQNKAFARATVNRVWALMFSQPLVNPVDDIPLFKPVPPMLDILANDFAANGFDLRRLIRLIVQSDAFQRASRAEFEITAEHEQTWAVFPITQLRPDQVSSSISQACQLTAIDDGSSIFTQLRKFGESQDFLKRFGDRGEDEFDSDAVTITQRLVMMNGKLVNDRTKQDLVNNAATRIAVLVPDDSQAIVVSYLAVLNRLPSEKEQATLEEYLAKFQRDQRQRAVGDVFWAMINSTEFSWNH